MHDDFPETIFEVPASSSSPEVSGIEVTCERCRSPYRIRRLRLQRGHRRLCPGCRVVVGRSHVAPPFVPDSSESERIRAQGLINKRIKLGKVERPAACQYCGKAGKTDGHHPDYSRPELIVFLCRSCHMKAHRSKAFEAEVAAKASSTGAVDSRYANRKAAEVGAA